MWFKIYSVSGTDPGMMTHRLVTVDSKIWVEDARSFVDLVEDVGQIIVSKNNNKEYEIIVYDDYIENREKESFMDKKKYMLKLKYEIRIHLANEARIILRDVTDIELKNGYLSCYDQNGRLSILIGAADIVTIRAMD